MPLLKRGPEVFPQDLFELSEREFSWAVARTRGRHEKALARQLEALEVPFYLPQRERLVRRGGRSLASYHPLFPGYVFLRPSAAQRTAALRSTGVVGVLEVEDQTVLNRELRALFMFQSSGASLVPYRALAAGESVSVVEGPFRGYTGVVLREQSRIRLIVSVSMLNERVGIEFERSCLARESGSARTDASQNAVA